MTPVIDVVFNLLIFFMLAAELTASATALNLPQVYESHRRSSASAAGHAVRVLAGGELLWDAKPLLTRQELAAEIGRLARSARARGTDPRDLRLTLEADRGASWGAVQEVLAMLAEAGVGQVQKKVLRREGGR